MHLPNDYRWRFFKNVKVAIENDLIIEARKYFEERIFGKVRKELLDKGWLNICALPLGMSYDGELFDIEVTIESQKKGVKNSSFRNFYYNFVYVDCKNLMSKIMPEVLENGDTGLILFGYIDENSGLSFQPISIAKETKYGLETRSINNDVMYVIRFNNLFGNKYCYLDLIEMDRSGFDEFEKMIKEEYGTRNPDKEETRKIKTLDKFRNKEFPDDFPVLIYKKNGVSEQVWVRICKYDKGEMTGILLNQPYADFGIKLGDMIKFHLFKFDDGNIVLVSPQ